MHSNHETWFYCQMTASATFPDKDGGFYAEELQTSRDNRKAEEQQNWQIKEKKTTTTKHMFQKLFCSHYEQQIGFLLRCLTQVEQSGEACKIRYANPF